jgi:hypothetical protein
MKMKTRSTRTWDTAKAVLRGKFITMSAYTKRSEKSQINDLMLYRKLLEKKKSKSQNKQKERNNKNWAEINETEPTTTIKNIKNQ